MGKRFFNFSLDVQEEISENWGYPPAEWDAPNASFSGTLRARVSQVQIKDMLIVVGYFNYVLT
jgi:hypothetical protein